VALRVRLATAEEMAAVYALRHDVFVVGQDVPLDLEQDEYDATADHVVAFDGDDLVGTGRLVDGRVAEDGLVVPGTVGTVGTIGRVAVAAAARGACIGRAVLDALVALAEQRGLPAVELHAQLQARTFYERAGFLRPGDPYVEAGIEHIAMRREL
jgi:predicted GNAT family N-acyltransferase